MNRAVMAALLTIAVFATLVTDGGGPVRVILLIALIVNSLPALATIPDRIRRRR